MIMVPLYLQKYIIKILAKYIDRKNKIIDIIGVTSNYRDDEFKIKKLMINIALVNKEWFKTLSNNLSVAVDFNYKDGDDKWSIIKSENIKNLKIHYDHQKLYFYKRMNGIDNQISLEYVNQRLENLSNSIITNCETSGSNIRKLIFRNINRSTHEVELDILNELYKISDNGSSNNLYLLEYELNGNTNLDKIKEDFKFIRKVFSIKFIDFFDKEIILETFKNKLWLKSFKQLIIVSNFMQPEFKIFETLTGTTTSTSSSSKKEEIENGENLLINFESFEIFGIEVSLNDVGLILTKTKNLKHLSLNFCFDNCIYYLSTDEERSKMEIPRCNCNSLVDGENEENEDFKNNWNELVNLFSKNKTLLQLEFGNECINIGSISNWGSRELPTSFINEISRLVSSITTLEKFVINGINTAKLFTEILKVNQTITDYDVSANAGSCDFEEFIESINSLLTVNPHIRQFKFSKGIFTNVYKEEVLIDYK